MKRKGRKGEGGVSQKAVIAVQKKSNLLRAT